ncbi:MAG: putative metal-binding motif-containing protein [Candidatus Sulfomarinibacteraceae bacterium]
MRRSVLIVMLLCAAVAWGDDGEMLRRDLSKTPDEHTEHAAMTMLELYVPAQTSDGTLLETDGIVYYLPDGTAVPDDTYENNRLYARPLIAFFQDGHGEEVEGTAFMHGERDAFAAVSLDDGETWKRSNLSKSAELSSFKIKADGRKRVPYPGDVVRLFAASAGNKAIVVWASRYCGGGNPSYAMENDPDRINVATLMDLDLEACTDEDLITTPCLYLEDHFGVSGSQGSSDFADEGFPEIGEVPYSCMWAARGVLLPPAADGEISNFVWFKPERLTSGRRDANRMEVHCEAGAGCVATWQEDPEGLRPGEGEGPGEGFSGAIAHHETDTWYSYISWDNFDLVATDDGYGNLYAETGSVVTWVAENVTGSPSAAVPMSIPVRLTDNAMCTMRDSFNPGEWNQLVDDDPYCYMDFDDTGTFDICSEVVDLTVPDPASGQPSTIFNVCLAEDGRLMRGNTASTRPRTNLRGYDFDGDGAYDSAWVIAAYEESKGLGEEELDAGLVDTSSDDEMTKIDMGKNIWYHTFDMSEPEVVSQGLILNQPAQYKVDFQTVGRLVSAGDEEFNFMLIDPDPIYSDQAALGEDSTTLYQTEIARRFSLISQDVADVGPSGTVAFAMWKQGIIRRGGPADVMARRFVVPDEFDPAVDNPYDYANMVCDRWSFDDGSNPRYVKGICLDSAIGLSNTELGDCEDGTSGAECAELFSWNEYFDDRLGVSQGGAEIVKVETWSQVDPATVDDEGNFDDTSWANPYDVAKGHRGFMDGDFIMVLYAWSPNWLANTVGHDNYNLYVRRSFDGGQTWTTTPASFAHTDGVTYTGNGTTTCEWMTMDTCDAGPVSASGECPVCTTYAAGDFEQARNLSQLVGTGETILDPRYSPTRPSITVESVYSDDEIDFSSYVVPYLDDTRDPSRFFMVYETGDNTTVAEGEAEPLDLYYSRGVNWGDHFLVWAELTDLTTCLPSADTEDDYDLSGFCNEFDWVEGSQNSLSGEASVTANPGGTQFYAVWNQEDVDGDEVIASDAWFRRVAFYDGYIPAEDDPTGPGNTDEDGDTYIADWDGGNDCDDGNPFIHPGATEICDDGIDQDCDGIDPACEPPPACWPKGTPCDSSTALECCSGMCHPVKHTCK